MHLAGTKHISLFGHSKESPAIPFYIVVGRTVYVSDPLVTF